MVGLIELNYYLIRMIINLTEDKIGLRVRFICLKFLMSSKQNISNCDTNCIRYFCNCLFGLVYCLLVCISLEQPHKAVLFSLFIKTHQCFVDKIEINNSYNSL